MNMGISMDPKVFYQTQTGKYNRMHIKGELTDAKIVAYAQAGYYGDEVKRKALELSTPKDRSGEPVSTRRQLKERIRRLLS